MSPEKLIFEPCFRQRSLSRSPGGEAFKSPLKGLDTHLPGGSGIGTRNIYPLRQAFAWRTREKYSIFSRDNTPKISRGTSPEASRAYVAAANIVIITNHNRYTSISERGRIKARKTTRRVTRLRSDGSDGPAVARK